MLLEHCVNEDCKLVCWIYNSQLISNGSIILTELLCCLTGPGHPVLNCGSVFWRKLSQFSINVLIQGSVFALLVWLGFEASPSQEWVHSSRDNSSEAELNSCWSGGEAIKEHYSDVWQMCPAIPVCKLVWEVWWSAEQCLKGWLITPFCCVLFEHPCPCTEGGFVWRYTWDCRPSSQGPLWWQSL